MWMQMIVLAGCLETAAGVAAGPFLSASDLLDRYEAGQAGIRRFSDESIGVAEVTTPRGRTFEREKSTFHSDGDKVHWRYRRWRGLNAADEAAPPEDATCRSFLWDGRTAYEYRLEKNVAGKLFIHSNDRLKTGMVGLGYAGSPLLGVFKGDTAPVGSILRQARTLTVRPEREEVAGSSCYILDAVTEQGRYTLWLDPDHGYNIARARVHKKTGDLAWGAGRLGGTPNAGSLPSSAGGAQDARSESISFTLENVRFDRIGEVWVPMEADYESIYNQGNSTTTARFHHRRTRFHLEPDFDAIRAFLPDIPDGTRTFVMDAPGITYEWWENKAIPMVGENIWPT